MQSDAQLLRSYAQDRSESAFTELVRRHISLVYSAAVRDLHRYYPKQFVTDAHTTCAPLWANNPYLTALSEDDRKVEVIDCHYPLIDRCNETPYHCIHGYIEFLNEHLDLQIKPTEFRGDIHLSDEEKSWYSQVHELAGQDIPFWIVAAGGKYDVTIKWWQTQRYQKVVDHFRGKVLFVQVGELGHQHPRLEGVVDLRGKTDLRQLVRLIHHAQGLLCPVTCLMHFAAAIETKPGAPPNRPCVVVAGGREPVHWEAYPHHQFIHTVGALPCCAHGGCWRSRTRPLGDGDERDRPQQLCLDVVGDLPRCMHMITADEVIRRIELYFGGSALRYLTPAQARAARKAVGATASKPFDSGPLNIHNARMASEKFVETIPAYPGGFRGRGIVICAGGTTYFANAWVCLHLLRRLGCPLPVQFWHLGEEELDERMRRLVAPFDVECVDAYQVKKTHPARALRGWELKPYAILHCPFREVLLLDADNVPAVSPEFLFETAQFKAAGAIFWPDLGRLASSRDIWNICGVPFRDEPEFETGQIVIDKKRCWAALSLCMWYNENSDFYYQHVHGDKETFHLAFRKLNKSYAMPATPVRSAHGVAWQHDFAGQRIFQHRTCCKWTLSGRNQTVKGFVHETECLAALANLRRQWDGKIRATTFGLSGNQRPG